MREERPATDTTHRIDAVYRGDDVEVAVRGRLHRGDDVEVAVRGRLHRADGSVAFGFVDVFAVEADRLARLTTYTNGRVE